MVEARSVSELKSKKLLKPNREFHFNSYVAIICLNYSFGIKNLNERKDQNFEWRDC